MSRWQTKKRSYRGTLWHVSIVGLTAAITLAAATPRAAGVTYETRAYSGDAAPGTEAGVVFSTFGFPTINAAGQVAFDARLAGSGVDGTNDQGLWSEATGSVGNPSLIARTGEAPPGLTPGIEYSRMGSDSVLNDLGQTAYVAVLAGTGVDSTNDIGIWSEAAGSSGSPGLIVHEGSSAPGTLQGVRFNRIFNPAFNNAGQTAFRSNLVGTGVDSSNNDSIWSEAAGSVGSPELIARSGDAAPGTPNGVNFAGFGLPVLNAAGQTAFQGTLAGTGIDRNNDEGIWSEAAGSIGNPGLVARAGQAALGTPTGVNFSSFEKPVINSSGQTAFIGSVAGTGVDASNTRGIWSEAAGSLGNPGLIKRAGDPAFSFGRGVSFEFFFSPVINDAGQTAFVASVSGPNLSNANNTGIWSESLGTIGDPIRVVRAGQDAPGTGPGIYFTSFDRPILNNIGQIVFGARLSGPGTRSFNDEGIWVTTPDGQIIPVIREGDFIDVDDDPQNQVFRTVSSIGMHLGFSRENGQASPFNDSGQLAFSATFTDGSSGLFVANTLAKLLVGDYNGNGVVDSADYTLWADSFGSANDLKADGNGDGVVDAADYTIWADNFGSSLPGGAVSSIAVPEPGTMALVLAGLITTARSRRRSLRSTI